MNQSIWLVNSIFADDFMGIAESPGELQHGITVARAWSVQQINGACKPINIGPAKTAVMVFAPEHAPPTPPRGSPAVGHGATAYAASSEAVQVCT
jgi:hypothetical protein